MKNFLTLFILFFSSSVLAEDISDFQIEDISIGDSLLDYFTLEEIESNRRETSYKKKDYVKYEFLYLSFFKTYDGIQFFTKSNDKSYKIESLSGAIFYENIDTCLTDKDKIVSSIQKLFDKSVLFLDAGIKNHASDKTGKSKTYSVYFYFESGDYIKVRCVDWSKTIEEEYGWSDNLAIIMTTNQFNKWVNTAF